MNTLFKELLLRIMVSGALCSLSMILAGNSAAKEPVRICCAAFTVIALFSPFKNNIPDFSVLASDAAQIENTVDKELYNADAALVQETIQNTETLIRQSLNELGIDAMVKISHVVDGNVLNITSVTVRANDSTNDKEAVKNILTERFGIDNDLILFEEDENENKNSGIY